LDKYQRIITSVNKPYGLHRTREEDIFIGDKILSIRKCLKPSFSLVSFPCYVSRAFLIIRTDKAPLKYLLAIMNSKLISFWLLYKGKLQGNMFQIDKVPLLSIPFANATTIMQKQLISIVNEILAITKTDAYLNNNEKKLKIQALEAEINHKVYELYGLTDDEIQIIESNG